MRRCLDKKSFLNRAVFCRPRAERGTTLVEFALVFILFMTLILGVIGFGHGLFVYHHLNNAAKEATRYAAVRGSTCSNDLSCLASNSASGIAGPTTKADVKKYVQNITPQSIDATKLTVTVCGVSDAAACAASAPAVCTAAVGSGSSLVPATSYYHGCTVQVQVQYVYNFIVPLVGATPINMSSTSDMIIIH